VEGSTLSQSDYENIVLTHYARLEVQKEIAQYSQSRWVAVHCELLNAQGYQVLLRYQRGTEKAKMPLKITEPDDVQVLLERFHRLRPRTFYASICSYKELSTQTDLTDLNNVLFCAPTWDIDNEPAKWKATVEAAKEILVFLQREGVSKSVFLMWSGKGMHVHLHQRALSPNLLQKIAPIDCAYSAVKYTIRALSDRFAKIAGTHHADALKVKNEIDVQRVFTCPLSLHRSLNSIAVCIQPDLLTNFTPDWTKVEAYRHWRNWDQFEMGEADAFAEKAYRSVGGYMSKLPKLKPRKKLASDSLLKWAKGR
jgi:hypothetical protein